MEIPKSKTDRNLGIVIGDDLSWPDQVQQVCKSSYTYLHYIYKICKIVIIPKANKQGVSFGI